MKLMRRKSGDLLRRFAQRAAEYGPAETKRRNTAAATVMVAAVFVMGHISPVECACAHETNNHPLCGCALQVIPKRTPHCYNRVVQALK